MSLLYRSKNRKKKIKFSEENESAIKTQELEQVIKDKIDSIKDKGIVYQLREVNKLLLFTDLWFEYELDEKRIDLCIHQREVLNKRYDHLLNKAKKLKITSEPFINL